MGAVQISALYIVTADYPDELETALDVGFVGLGDQGALIAARIAESDLPLHLWARRSVSLDDFRDRAASIAASLAELGRRSDVVGLCVVDDADVRDVVLGNGLLSEMRAGSIITIHSTIDPETCHEIANAAATRGVAVLDAPVSRQTWDAQKFTVLVGGDPAVFERAIPMLETFGDPVRLLGPLGAGQQAKVINNVILLANMKIAVDSLDLAARHGIDRAMLLDILSCSSGRSFALDVLKTRPAERGDIPRLMAKELEIFRRRLCTDNELPPSLSATAEMLLSEMKADPAAWSPNWYVEREDQS